MSSEKEKLEAIENAMEYAQTKQGVLESLKERTREQDFELDMCKATVERGYQTLAYYGTDIDVPASYTCHQCHLSSYSGYCSKCRTEKYVRKKT